MEVLKIIHIWHWNDVEISISGVSIVLPTTAIFWYYFTQFLGILSLVSVSIKPNSWHYLVIK